MSRLKCTDPVLSPRHKVIKPGFGTRQFGEGYADPVLSRNQSRQTERFRPVPGCRRDLDPDGNDHYMGRLHLPCPCRLGTDVLPVPHGSCPIDGVGNFRLFPALSSGYCAPRRVPGRGGHHYHVRHRWCTWTVWSLAGSHQRLITRDRFSCCTSDRQGQQLAATSGCRNPKDIWRNYQCLNMWKLLSSVAGKQG
jgi:hypothetical protein